MLSHYLFYLIHWNNVGIPASRNRVAVLLYKFVEKGTKRRALFTAGATFLTSKRFSSLLNRPTLDFQTPIPSFTTTVKDIDTVRLSRVSQGCVNGGGGGHSQNLGSKKVHPTKFLKLLRKCRREQCWLNLKQNFLSKC